MAHIASSSRFSFIRLARTCSEALRAALETRRGAYSNGMSTSIKLPGVAAFTVVE